MVKVFLTSDTHFYHKNVIAYDNRPFKDVEEMNEALIDNWNRVVDDGDLICHTGDFCWKGTKVMGELVKKLKGIKILLRGNHDKKSQSVFENAGFYCCENHIFIRDMFIGHYPIYADDEIPPKWKDSWYKDYKQMVVDSGIRKIIHGHVHSNAFVPDDRFDHFNVGTCLHNYTPVSMIDVLNYFNRGNIRNDNTRCASSYQN